MNRFRRAAQCALIGAVAAFGPCAAHAQAYPTKPVRLVAGFAAGSSTDATARLVAQKLTEHLGQNVVVENRTGAAGAIANERVATSPPDGYTLLMLTPGATILPALRSNLPYDLLRDFAPISLVASGPLMLVVHPSVPARDVAELIALARRQPGKLSYGSSGIGSFQHLAGELFNLMAKTSIVQIPYKGGSESVVAAVAGHIDISFPSVTTALPLLESRKLRALAVTSTYREPLTPNVPTLHESGLRGYDRTVWYGLAAPAAVPREIVLRLNGVITKAFNTPDAKTAMSRLGASVRTSSPEEFAAFVRAEVAQNAKLASFAGIRRE